MPPLIIIAIIATVAIVGTIQAGQAGAPWWSLVLFGPFAMAFAPKPAGISLGFQGDLGGSPRYGTFGPINNTVSNELAVPVIYGQLLYAGNILWQSDPGSTVQRLIGVSEGPINSFVANNVKANNVDITTLSGCSFTGYTGTTTQQADSRLPASLRPDLEFHNLAYLAVTLTASDQLKGGDPTITALVQGILVQTWLNGAWTTTASYSNNPAACLRDFLTNVRYGLGIPVTNIDATTFGAAFDYCAELVASPTGPEARFQLDYVIDAQRPAQDVLNDMLSTFSGFLVYSGSTVKLNIEKQVGITQYFGDGSTTKANASFDPGNIVKDSFTWNMSSVDDRPNRLKVQWLDPSQNYVKVYTQVEDRIDQDARDTVIVKEVALLGITRQTQASRMAKFMMAQIKYANISVTFAASLESIHCEVGDVICITHQAAKFTRKQFRIIDMQEAENEKIQFSCREYNPFIYNDGQASAIITYTQPAGPNLFAPLSDITGLTLIEDNFKNKDGVFVTNILTSWTAISADQLLRLDRHLIQMSSDGGATYRGMAFAASNQTSYRIVLGNVHTGTTFTIRVKTVSDRGATSAGTTGILTISGKRTPPSDVSDFDVTFAFNHIAMTWSAINDEDLFGYEIRVGDSNSIWETAAIVTTEALGTRYDLLNFTRGAKKYFIKAIDNSGNYSQNAAADSLTITNIPASNVVFTFDIWQYVMEFPHPLQGVLSSNLDRIITNDYDPTYNRITFQPLTDQTWRQRQTAGGTWAALQASAFRWGQENFVTSQESYTTSVIDLGAVFNASYILDIQTYSSSNLGFVSVQIATSTDGITFTAFKPFVAGNQNTRYVKFQFLIQATAASTKVRIVSAILTVDMPDKNERFLNQTIGAGGSTITLTQNFISVKSIVVTTVGTSALTPRIDDQSNLPISFIIKMFDTSGVLQAGSVNIWASGY